MKVVGKPLNESSCLVGKVSKRLPEKVKREVDARSGRMCEWVDEETGRRCCSTQMLERAHNGSRSREPYNLTGSIFDSAIEEEQYFQMRNLKRGVLI